MVITELMGEHLDIDVVALRKIIDEVIQERQIRQMDLAELLGYDGSSLSRIRTGKQKPSAVFLARLANLAHMSFETLLERVIGRGADREGQSERDAGVSSQTISSGAMAMAEIIDELPEEDRRMVLNYILGLRRKHK